MSSSLDLNFLTQNSVSYILMKYNAYFLPNGQQINVKLSFRGFIFTVDEHSLHGSFPPGWLISLYTENASEGKPSIDGDGQFLLDPVWSFTRPTLLSDVLHLSSMSTPSINLRNLRALLVDKWP
jgi:hypothetical protein